MKRIVQNKMDEQAASAGDAKAVEEATQTSDAKA
jgi:hypothetical protein